MVERRWGFRHQHSSIVLHLIQVENPIKRRKTCTLTRHESVPSTRSLPTEGAGDSTRVTGRSHNGSSTGRVQFRAITYTMVALPLLRRFILRCVDRVPVARLVR